MIERTMRMHSQKMINDIVHLCKLIPENTVGVEVGCFAGESAMLFAQSGKFKKLLCLDPWEQGYYKKHDMREVEKSFDERLEGVECVIKIKGSSALLEMIGIKNHVNFIYIDANHNYDHVVHDIQVARKVLISSATPVPKILAGHDYGFPKSPGVKQAVDGLLGYPDVIFAGYSWVKFL